MLSSKWMHCIRGYYVGRKIIINLGCYFAWHLLVSSFTQQVGKGWGKDGNRYFSPLRVLLYKLLDFTH